MKRVNNVAQLFIAKDISMSVSQEDTINDYTDFTADGEMTLVKENGVVPDFDSGSGDINDLDQCKYLRLVQRSGTELIWSDLIEVTNVTNYSIEGYSAASQQVDYVGYNGSAGSIDVYDDEFYRISLTFNPSDTMGFVRNLIKSLVYKSDTTATQAEIAYGLANSGAGTFNADKEMKGKVLVERVCNTSTAAATDLDSGGNTTGTLNMVKGSKYVSMTDSQDLSVGDYIRFGQTLTTPIYKITANDTSNNVVTLDIPYQADSGTLLPANGEFITAAQAAVADFGIKFSAQERTFYNPPQYLYNLIRFETQLTDGFVNTEVTKDTAADRGVGTYREVAELERQLQDNERGDYENYASNPQYRTDATEGTTYNMYCIEYKDVTTSTTGETPSLKQLYVAIPVESSGDHSTNVTTGIQIVLDEWLVDDFSVPGITKQSANLT